MLPLAGVHHFFAEFVHPLEPVALPLAAARGRILHEDVLSPDDLPAFDRSAMDGYAVDAGDLSESFRVVLEVQAGHPAAGKIGPGECARIFTGAQIPEGASQVIMQEDVTREGDRMIPRRRDAKTWIRRRSEDARRGDLLMSFGTRLGAGELSLLAQLGLTHPRVTPAPRVLHFATGDELVDPSAAPALGQIRDSNSTLVAALLAEVGSDLIVQGRCGDAPLALVEAVRQQAPDSWDVLLISGGASVGDYDFGARALEELGFTMHFRQINLRPGKPLIFATRERQIAFVIPGNPLSHFVTFHAAIRRALDRLEGAVPSWPLTKISIAADMPAKPDQRHTMWPARVAVEAGELRAWPLAWQSSGDLRGLINANALLQVEAGSSGAKKGELVDCLLLAAGL